MAAHDTLHRHGSWTIELIFPLRAGGKPVEAITIQPAEFDHAIRWGDGKIPSTLALLAELSGVAESVLRTLKYPDVDRVMLAFSNVIKSTPILADFQSGTRPMATPTEEKEQDKIEVLAGASDDVDPRFPKVSGPVRRFAPPADDGGDDPLAAAGGPEIIKKVT